MRLKLDSRLTKSAMHQVVISIIVCILPCIYCSRYLPSVFWDPTNPILQRRFWNDVVPVKIFDSMTFICPNKIVRMVGGTTRSNGLGFQNLYVKEISGHTKSFDNICDTKNAKLIMECDKPTGKELISQDIVVNVNQPYPNLPKFIQGKDYMFFATSNGTKESLKTNSTKCTMVFRIHFNGIKRHLSSPICPLFGREKVCEGLSINTSQECTNIVPQNVNITRTTSNSVSLVWEPPLNEHCNITHYTVCHRQRQTASCKRNSVPAKQQSITLNGLTAYQTYFIKVQAHTDKGPGEYCEEISFSTSGPNEPESLAQKDDENILRNAGSIGIGFALGVVTTLIIGVTIWILISRFNKKKNCQEKSENPSQNNPNFCKSDEPKEPKKVMNLNTGYRESGQNWKLPQVREEENLHLYDSQA